MENEINVKNIVDDFNKSIQKEKRKDIGDIVYTKAMLENMLDVKKKEPIVENPSSISNDNIKIEQKIIPESSALTIMGIKIDLSEKKQSYIVAFKKYYVESKSHNLLLGAYAAAKAGFYSMALSFMGVSTDQIEDLKREAGSSAIAKNIELFNENENSSELGKIAGGSKKYLKALEKLANEIRNQLIRQCENLGLKGYFTQEKIAQIKIEQCQNIKSKLEEEKTNLEYQIKMAQLGSSLSEMPEEIGKKINKIDQLLGRVEMRVSQLQRELDKIIAKASKNIKDRIAFQRADTY